MRPFKIYEVSAREGFQRQAARPLAAAVTLIKLVAAAGIKHLEVGSFVNPKVVPAMANTAELLKTLGQLPELADVQFSVLIPRATAFLPAAELGVAQVAWAVARDAAFQEKNFHQTIAEAVAGLRLVYEQREQKYPGIKIKVYLMMAWLPNKPLAEDRALLQTLAAWADELCLADTAAEATPATLQEALQTVQEVVPLSKIGLHLHGLAERVLSLGKLAASLGVANFDTALAEQGGCPFIAEPAANADTLAFCQMLSKHFGTDESWFKEDLLKQAAAAWALAAKGPR